MRYARYEQCCALAGSGNRLGASCPTCMVNQRRKGHDFERQLAARLREAMPGAEVKRGLQGRGGKDAPDVECPVFWVEAKRGSRAYVKPLAALAQAMADAPPDRIPVAITKVDRAAATVTLPLDAFLAIVREWWLSGDASTRGQP